MPVFRGTDADEVIRPRNVSSSVTGYGSFPGTGADLIIGGAGDDTLNGGINETGYRDTIRGGDGYDIVQIDGRWWDNDLMWLWAGPNGEASSSATIFTAEEIVFRPRRGEDFVHLKDLRDVDHLHKVVVDLTYSAENERGDGFADWTLIDLGDEPSRIQIEMGGRAVLVKGAGALIEILGREPDMDTIEIFGGTGNDRIDASQMSARVWLDGSIGNDTLIGGAGNDRFIAGDADVLVGGEGNDFYFNASGSVIREATAGGNDTVESFETYSLESVRNVERLILSESWFHGFSAIDGTGNELGNLLRGNKAENALRGLDGGDTLRGGAGNDSLFGGNGQDVLVGGKGQDHFDGGADADIFVFASAKAGSDTIHAFDPAVDRFSLQDGAFTAASEVGGSTLLTHAGGRILVEGIVGLDLAAWNGLVLPDYPG